jgi:hypothetical protein
MNLKKKETEKNQLFTNAKGKSRIEDVSNRRTKRREGFKSLIITLGCEQRSNSPHIENEW